MGKNLMSSSRLKGHVLDRRFEWFFRMYSTDSQTSPLQYIEPGSVGESTMNMITSCEFKRMNLSFIPSPIASVYNTSLKHSSKQLLNNIDTLLCGRCY